MTCGGHPAPRPQDPTPGPGPWAVRASRRQLAHVGVSTWRSWGSKGLKYPQEILEDACSGDGAAACVGGPPHPRRLHRLCVHGQLGATQHTQHSTTQQATHSTIQHGATHNMAQQSRTQHDTHSTTHTARHSTHIAAHTAHTLQWGEEESFQQLLLLLGPQVISATPRGPESLRLQIPSRAGPPSGSGRGAENEPREVAAPGPQ